MGVFDNFPYTNVHDLNTDWLVKTVKEVKDKAENIDQSVLDAKEYADNAKTSEDNAKTSEDNAKTSEDNAKTSEDNARDILADIHSVIDPLNNQILLNTQGIAVNSARIDAFTTLARGSTTGDAELMDIRVGANGITYRTAGDAVRGQYDELENQISDIINGVSEIKDQNNFARGGLNPDGTLLATQVYRVSCAVPITYDYDVQIKIASGYAWGYITMIGGVAGAWNGWYTDANTITIPANTPFVLQTRLEPETYQTVTDIIPFIKAYKVTSLLSSNIKAIENYIGINVSGHTYSGEKIPSVLNRFKSSQLFQMYYSGDTSQDIEFYNDYIFVAFSSDTLKVYSNSGTLLASMSVPLNHGTGMQFSSEFYDPGDVFPLLYVGGWNNNFINIVRIEFSNNIWNASVIKTLYIPTTYGYYMSPSLNNDLNIMYCYGYKNNTIGAFDNNKMILVTCDLNNLTLNDDTTYTPEIISVIEMPYEGIMQGRKYMSGRLLVGFANRSNPFKPRLISVNVADGSKVTDIDMTAVVGNTECEGVAFKIHNNVVTWIYSEYYKIYQLDFS